jgi:hypothetical protein
MANDSNSEKEPEIRVAKIQRPANSQPLAEFNFAQYKKAVLRNSAARRIVEDFLKYRPREWEENLAEPGPLTDRKPVR